MLLCAMDGIKYALVNERNEDELLKELSKEPNEDATYLEKGRAYRSEKDVFEDFTDEEREKYFGIVPETVFENVKAFETFKDKVKVLQEGDILTEKIIESYKTSLITKWLLEVEHRIIPAFTEEIRDMKMMHNPSMSSDVDMTNWMKIRDLRYDLAKDHSNRVSLFTKIRNAIKNGDLDEVSNLQKEMYILMDELRNDYRRYKRNLLDI